MDGPLVVDGTSVKVIHRVPTPCGGLVLTTRRGRGPSDLATTADVDGSTLAAPEKPEWGVVGGVEVTQEPFQRITGLLSLLESGVPASPLSRPVPVVDRIGSRRTYVHTSGSGRNGTLSTVMGVLPTPQSP